MIPISDLLNYYGPLHDDIERCILGIKLGEDLNYWKRSYLRCLCTFVEARVHLIKEELLSVGHLIPKSTLSHEQISFLRSEDWRFSNIGDINIRGKIVSPVDELKAVIKILGGSFPKLKWDFSSKRWSRVKQLYQSRNRLVHPKSPDDIILTSNDIAEFEVFRHDFNDWSSQIYHEAWGHRNISL